MEISIGCATGELFNCGTCGGTTALTGDELVVFEMAIGCEQCNLATESLIIFEYPPSSGLLYRTCQNVLPVDMQALGKTLTCTLTEYYNSTTGACESCSSKFPNCIGCNADKCLVCASSYFMATLFDSSYNTYQQCMHNFCGSNKGPDLSLGHTMCKSRF